MSLSPLLQFTVKAITLFSLFFIDVNSIFNLINNGDLQSYQVYEAQMVNAGTQIFQFYSSNVSQWYEKNTLDFIEIKKKTGNITTFCLQLATSYPIVVCQNITLKPNHKYQLRYSAFCQDRIQQINFTVTVNGILKSFLYIETSNTFSNKTDYFYSQSDTVFHSICFSEVHLPIPSFQNYWGNSGIGGLIDNISIIQTQLHRVIFQPRFKQNSSIITFLSDLKYNQSIAIQFLNQYLLKILGQTIEKIQYKNSSNGFLEIQAVVMFGFHLQSVQFLLNNSPDQLIYFQIEIQELNLYFHNLSESSKIIIEYCRSIGGQISKQVLSITNLLKFTVCSYIVISLLNFQILMLFYVFLDFELVPEFTKQIYYDLLRSNVQIGSISNWLQSIGLNKQAFFQLEVQMQDIPELIEKQRNSKKWLGQFNFSSLLYNNSIDFILVFSLMIIKIFILKIFLEFLGNQRRKKLGINISYMQILMVEFMSNIPSFIISSQARIVNSSNGVAETGEKIGQILLNFFCFNAISIYWVKGQTRKKRLNQKDREVYRSNAQTKNQILKQKQLLKNKQGKIKQNNIKVKLIFGQHQQKAISKVQFKKRFKNLIHNHTHKSLLKRLVINDFSEFIHFLSVPFLVILSNPKIFMVVNSFVFSFKMLAHLYHSNRDYFIMKIIKTLINIIWILQHTAFLIFFVMEQQKMNGIDVYEKYSTELVILGISLVLTVIVGFFLETLKLLVNCIATILKLIKKVKKYCKQKEIYPLKRDKELKKEGKLKAQVKQKCNKKQPKLLLTVEDIVQQQQLKKNNKFILIKRQNNGKKVSMPKKKKKQIKKKEIQQKIQKENQIRLHDGEKKKAIIDNGGSNSAVFIFCRGRKQQLIKQENT